MSIRKMKKTVLHLLEVGNLDEIRQKLDEIPVKVVVNALFSAICRDNDQLRWKAIQCMGIYVGRLAEEDMEEARIVMRRLLWSLNDESGGIGWGAPESMAEIMVCHKELAEEYIHMLISYMREDGEELFQDGNYLEHEVLQRGLLWGIGRLAAARPKMLLQRNVPTDLLHYLDSADPTVRGLAARNLGLLAAEEAVPALQKREDDRSPVILFEHGELKTVTVGSLAGRALEQISSKIGK